jgi:hypothetical protein
MGKDRDGLYLPLYRLELVIPEAYDFIHRRRWRGKLLFCTVVVEHCVVILNLNLCCEEVR